VDFFHKGGLGGGVAQPSLLYYSGVDASKRHNYLHIWGTGRGRGKLKEKKGKPIMTIRAVCDHIALSLSLFGPLSRRGTVPKPKKIRAGRLILAWVGRPQKNWVGETDYVYPGTGRRRHQSDPGPGALGPGHRCLSPGLA